MALKHSGVYELLSKIITVPDIKAAVDLDLSPLAPPPPTLMTISMLNAMHQPFDFARGQLIVPPIRWRQSKREPVPAIVMQIIGNLLAEILQDFMLFSIDTVDSLCFAGSNVLSNCCVSIIMLSTTVKSVTQAARMLCPPPNAALECVCQASLGLPDAGPIVATGSLQNSPSLGATPLGTCVGSKNDLLSKLCNRENEIWPEQTFFSQSLRKMCTVCSEFAQSVHSVHKVCTKFAFCQNRYIVPDNIPVLVQTLCKLCAHCAHCVHTLCKLCAHSVHILHTVHTVQTVCKPCVNYVQTMCKPL